METVQRSIGQLNGIFVTVRIINFQFMNILSYESILKQRLTTFNGED